MPTTSNDKEEYIEKLHYHKKKVKYCLHPMSLDTMLQA